MRDSASIGSGVPSRVQDYVDAIVEECADDGKGLVSVVLFGSAAIGGWMGSVSDVDLILVVPDCAADEYIDRLRERVERIELSRGFCSHSGQDRAAVERFVDKVSARDRTFFVCRRSDLLSGDIGRILRLHPLQAICVDRIVLANLVASGMTVWGEAILPRVPVAPIRRLDIVLALLGPLPLALVSAALYPVHREMTRYAIGVLKSSVHSCYFCYERRRASLEAEVDFFEKRAGSNRTLTELLGLRREYRDSFSFVVRCIPTLAALHVRTLIDCRFPWRTGR